MSNIVKNIMIPKDKVFAVTFSNPISLTAALIIKHKIGSVIILDGDEIGIVTKSDLISKKNN
jgi:CBS domain containing-hemolysin-like protein